MPTLSEGKSKPFGGLKSQGGMVCLHFPLLLVVAAGVKCIQCSLMERPLAFRTSRQAQQRDTILLHHRHHHHHHQYPCPALLISPRVKLDKTNKQLQNDVLG